MSTIAANIAAMVDRVNSLAANEEPVKLSVEQLKHLIACFGVDEDLRIMFGFTVAQARAAVEMHAVRSDD